MAVLNERDAAMRAGAALTATGRVAVLFPGQGSQSAGMGRGLLAAYPEGRALLDAWSAAVSVDLHALLTGPTLDAHPLRVHLAVVSLGMLGWRWLIDSGQLQPAACRALILSGHSLGEITALACAGALSAGDALRLAHERGRLIAEACSEAPGTMRAVVGLPVQEVMALLEGGSAGGVTSRTGDTPPRVWPANFNGPKQLVLAGAGDALDALEPLLRAQGANVLPLATAGAFHTPLMNRAAAALARFAGGLDFRPPEWPVLSSMHARLIGAPAGLPAHLGLQMVSPVRWLAVMQGLCRAGVDTAVELGPPGEVLLRLASTLEDWSPQVWSLSGLAANALTTSAVASAGH